jgi:hypothetical protein
VDENIDPRRAKSEWDENGRQGGQLSRLDYWIVDPSHAFHSAQSKALARALRGIAVPIGSRPFGDLAALNGNCTEPLKA